MKTACIFPGQGCQYVGMGKELRSPEAAQLFMRANDVLGFNLKKLCFEGPKEELDKTENTQPAVVTVSYAKFIERGITPDFVAGHSLGEYTAVSAAECLSFEDAVRTVRFRGKAMALSDGRRGAMGVALGIGAKELIPLCQEFELSIAAFNEEEQIVVSGAKGQIARFGKAVKDRGKKFLLLQVGCAAHSSFFMKNARQQLEGFLSSVPFRDPVMPIVANATADICQSGEKMKELLAVQLTEPVKWHQSVKTMLGMGVRNFLEMGPKEILSGLIEKIRERLLKEDKAGA